MVKRKPPKLPGWIYHRKDAAVSVKRNSARMAETVHSPQTRRKRPRENSAATLGVKQKVQGTPVLCPYCSDPLPVPLSPKLQAMLQSLELVSKPAPLLDNPDARMASVVVFGEFCQQHTLEARALPLAEAHGWPCSIDFDTIPQRIFSLQNKVGDIIGAPELSVVWCDLIERNEVDAVSGRRKVLGHFTSTSGVGYYGEMGYLRIAKTLRELYPQPPSHWQFPLDYDTFLVDILVPEVANILIEEDLGVSRNEATEIRQESMEYGLMMFRESS